MHRAGIKVAVITRVGTTDDAIVQNDRDVPP